MQAIILRELGEPDNLRLEHVADPEPAAGDVIIRLRAAALNHRDVWIRRGLYAGIKLPIILGSDGAGEVVTVGSSVDRTLIGQPVVINPSLDWGTNDRAQAKSFRILGLPDDGTYAQMVKVPAANVHAKPVALSFEEAAALPLAAVTAYRSVVTRARIKAGETVLITGIGGGVAVFALQIARHLGARVLVTSGSDAKLARARAMGAEGGANYHDESWHWVIKSLTNGGADVVIDSVGGDTFDRALDIVKPGGRVVTYGATKGPANVEVRRIFFKQLDVLGSTMGTPQDFEEMLTVYANADLRPPVDEVFELGDTESAHRRMESGEQFGKIVLRMPEKN